MARPYKGLRVRVTTRIPADVYQRAARAAKEHNLTMSEYVAAAVAAHTKEKPRDRR